MDAECVRTSAFAMPLTNPCYPPGHYRFVDRQYLIITYRSDPEAIGRVLPEPLEVTGPLVHLRVAHAAERHGDVRALAPAVDVQLVHHQERQLASHAQPGSMPDDAG